MYTLYGDGIHDDTKAIQELIDNASRELVLPAPEKFYLISDTLILPSDFRLVLPRFAEIRLADNSNCYMLRNKMSLLPEVERGEVEGYTHFYNRYRRDCPCENIEVSGGIWNFNNLNQAPNPIWTRKFVEPEFFGIGILFFHVKNLKLSDMTLKDPTNFAVTLDTVSWFTVENITFDFNYGNPVCLNMDGIHLNGNCHYGVLRNLKGACRDDLVALNADEGTCGPITNIQIDGIFATDCHSAVRILSIAQPVEKINISNVYGTYYQYCIGITTNANFPFESYVDTITLENIYASKATRYSYSYPAMEGYTYIYPLFIVEPGMHVKNLTLRNLHRREKEVGIPTVCVHDDARVDYLLMENVTVENETGVPCPVLTNYGMIDKLILRNVRAKGEEIVENKAVINQIYESF